MSPAALRRCDPSRQVRRLAGTALGTGWRIAYATSGFPTPIALRAAINARLASIVDQMSQWNPQSLLSRFNSASAGTWFELPVDFATVMTAALDVAERSDGAFDPTHGRAAWLLGFGAGSPDRPPLPWELDTAQRQAGWRKLEFDTATSRLRQPGGLWLDLSGIAKGFAVDALADLLNGLGIEDALIEIGGELAGRGLKPDGEPWWVDVENPPGVRLSPLRIALHELAVATSGDYVRGNHTIDPATGLASMSNTASVSVVHRSAMLADAWATALTVAGQHRGFELADVHQLAARMIVRSADGHTYVEGFSRKLSVMIGK